MSWVVLVTGLLLWIFSINRLRKAYKILAIAERYLAVGRQQRDEAYERNQVAIKMSEEVAESQRQAITLFERAKALAGEFSE